MHRNLNRPVVAAWILATVFFAAALSARAQDSHPDAANSVTTMITTPILNLLGIEDRGKQVQDLSIVEAA